MTAVLWWEKHQIWLYLTGIGAGALLGLTTPAAAQAQFAVAPALVALLFVTFLGVPFEKIVHGLKDTRFLTSAVVLNFAVVPLVVFALTRFIAHEHVLLVGVLFVLLTPCIDYVIVFAALAGGAKERLLAATPLLMIGQMVLLPVYLWLFIGADFLRTVPLAPFLEAF